MLNNDCLGELYFGFEREELDVFNLFVQHTETETRFNNLEDFESGLADDVYYGNANKNYSEKSKPNPRNVYGTSKLLADQYILSNSKKFYIIRVGKIQCFFTNIFIPINENSMFFIKRLCNFFGIL